MAVHKTSLIRVLLFLLAMWAGVAARAQGLLFEPGSAVFGNTVAGSTSVQTFAVTNHDPWPVMVTAVIPPANAAFAASHNCGVGSYAPFASCSISIVFKAPAQAGTVVDVFRFQTVNYGNLDIKLTGMSAGAPAAVPSVGPWALLLLAMLIGSGAAFHVRRRP